MKRVHSNRLHAHAASLCLLLAIASSSCASADRGGMHRVIPTGKPPEEGAQVRDAQGEKVAELAWCDLFRVAAGDFGGGPGLPHIEPLAVLTLRPSCASATPVLANVRWEGANGAEIAEGWSEIFLDGGHLEVHWKRGMSRRTAVLRIDESGELVVESR